MNNTTVSIAFKAWQTVAISGSWKQSYAYCNHCFWL